MTKSEEHGGSPQEPWGRKRDEEGGSSDDSPLPGHDRVSRGGGGLPEGAEHQTKAPGRDTEPGSGGGDPPPGMDPPARGDG